MVLFLCSYSKGPRKLHKVLGKILANYEQMGDADEEEANGDESDDANEDEANDDESDDENEEPPAKRKKTNVYCTKCNVHLCFVRG